MYLIFVVEFVYLYKINIVDSFLNTIDDMQNENDFFYRFKKFEYIQDFVIVF